MIINSSLFTKTENIMESITCLEQIQCPDCNSVAVSFNYIIQPDLPPEMFYECNQCHNIWS